MVLHMGKEGIEVFSKMSDEEKTRCKESCERGLKLLENNGERLKAKFMELLGLPANALKNENRIEPQPEEKLDKFIKNYKEKLSMIFKGLSDNNTLTANNIDDLLDGIERLSKIVEDGIYCNEAIKKNRVLRHDIENAISRLRLFTPLFSDKREGIRKELSDLNANLSSFDMDMIRKYFNMDMKNVFDSSVRLIQGYDGADSDDKISNMIKELISSLQKIVTVTLNIAPR